MGHWAARWSLHAEHPVAIGPPQEKLPTDGNHTPTPDNAFLQHIDKVFKHKDLQQQLVDAKLQQAQEGGYSLGSPSEAFGVQPYSVPDFPANRD